MHRMVNREFFLKVHVEDTVCLTVHEPKTSPEWIGRLPLAPGCAFRCVKLQKRRK